MVALNTTGIDHVNLQVIDLEETCAFYNALFGFEVLEDMPEQNGRIVGDKRAKLALYEVEGMQKYRKLGFAHVSFHVADFDRVETVCQGLGIEIQYEGILDWEHSSSCYINDPNGYEIELSKVWGGGL